MIKGLEGCFSFARVLQPFITRGRTTLSDPKPQGRYQCKKFASGTQSSFGCTYCKEIS